MNKILTNQITAIINEELIIKDFIICEYTTSEKYIKHGAKVLDIAIDIIKAKSIVFESGKKFYALFDKNENLCCNNFINDKEFDHISVREVHVESIEKHIIVRLFLNSLNNYQSEELKYNNLTGKLFCSHPEWYTRDKQGQVKQLKCLEVLVNRNMRIGINVSTFTSVKEIKWLKFNKKKPNEYPLYDLVGSNMLRRIDYNIEKGYIKKQYERKKNRIPFIDFSDWKKFSQSKCGILFKILNLFNEKLGKYISLNLYEIQEHETIEFEEGFDENGKIDLLRPIVLVDKLFTKDNDFIQSIRNRFCAVGFQNVSTSCELKKDAYNIVIINNKEFYEDNVDLIDPHIPHNDYIVQHITYEDFEDSDIIVNCVIKEMRIKQDITEGKITYAKWESFGFLKELNFCVKKSENSFSLLKINTNGEMFVEQIDSDILSTTKYQRLINQYNIIEVESKHKIECMIFNADFCSVVLFTGEYTFPQIKEIGDTLNAETKSFEISKQHLLEGLRTIKKLSKPSQTELNRIISDINLKDQVFFRRADILALTDNRSLKKEIATAIYELCGVVVKTYFRGESVREKLFSSNLNINHYKIDNDLFYFVGEKSKNIKTVFSTASSIRKIKTIDGKIDERIFKLLSVDFVRKEQLTVLPFPIKYLREYIKIDLVEE